MKRIPVKFLRMRNFEMLILVALNTQNHAGALLVATVGAAYCAKMVLRQILSHFIAV